MKLIRVKTKARVDRSYLSSKSIGAEPRQVTLTEGGREANLQIL